MAEDTSPGKHGVLATIAAGAVVVLSFILEHGSGEFGKWLGFALLFPIVVLVACCWAAGKLLNPEIKYLRLAAGVPAGQATIFLVSVMLLGAAALPAVALDVVVIAVGVVWLVTRPSIAPLLLLMAYEAFGLAMNAYALYAAGFNEGAIKALISAILVRIFALFVLYDGYKQMRARSLPAPG